MSDNNEYTEDLLAMLIMALVIMGLFWMSYTFLERVGDALLQ